MAYNPIARKEYYSIGEVCRITGLKPHVLRYWETQFKGLVPVKNRAGNRAYRRREIEMIQLVKKLLYEQKFTIEGARRRLAEMRREGGGMESELEEAKVKDTFENLASELGRVVDYIDDFHRGDAEAGEIRDTE